MNQPLDGLVEDETQTANSPSEPDIIIGSREQLFYLLAEASEIEHTLMCNYLYAVFSLKTGNDSNLSERESKAVLGWQKMMMSVAIEEMGHLLMVANLTSALGGLPHFGRPNFPVKPGYFPSGVVLKLTPFNQETLDHFIFLERPMGTDAEDAKGFDDAGFNREQSYQGLMPSAQDYETVSHLYEAIRANIIAFHDRVESDSVFIGSVDSQIGPNLIQMPGIEKINDLPAAMRAIDLIVEQGEGSSSDSEDSHYHRFQQIKDEYESLLIQNPDFAPSNPLAENPVMRKSAEMDNRVYIDSQPASQALDLANAIYGTLLRFLMQAYTKPESDPLKEKLVSAAFDLMHLLGAISKIIAKLPASENFPGVNAGMTFTMLRGIEPYSNGSAEIILIQERLKQLYEGAKQVSKVLPESEVLMGKFQTLQQKF